MDMWFRRAGFSLFAGLTAAIVAGGAIVLGGAALGRWIITSYPAEVALPIIVLATLLVAADLMFAGRHAFGPSHHDLAADPLHLLLARIGTERPGGLVFAAFLAGLALSLQARRPPHSPHPDAG
jgi:hypothetical protein